MRIAAMQPTYLPWMGYFDLMDQVDVFVILDDVQFARRSWQQRNRIKTPKGLEWLSVPVKVTSRREQLVSEVELADDAFWQAQARSIEVNYRKAPAFADYFEPLICHLRQADSECSPRRLVEINLATIRWLAELLGIRTPLVLSSALNVESVRSERLAEICTALGAGEYLSAHGSAAYLLQELDEFTRRNVKVYFHQYIHPSYRQNFGDFMSHASVIDLLFNEGAQAIEILRRGRRAPLLPQELGSMTLDRPASDFF